MQLWSSILTILCYFFNSNSSTAYNYREANFKNYLTCLTLAVILLLADCHSQFNLNLARNTNHTVAQNKLGKIQHLYLNFCKQNSLQKKRPFKIENFLNIIIPPHQKNRKIINNRTVIACSLQKHVFCLKVNLLKLKYYYQ